MEIIDRVKGAMAGYLEDKGIELVDITYRREGNGMVLRVLADTPQGITMAECEALNNYLSETLDRENVIEEHYTLEVSSPGLDRPMKTSRDFERSLGRKIEVTTYAAIDGRKMHEGALIGIDKETIVLESGGISVVIPRNMIARSQLKIEF